MLIRKLDSMTWAFYALLGSLFLVPGPVAAQGAPSAAPPAPAKPAAPATSANAEALFQAGEWEQAIVANEAVTKAEPGNGRAWFRLGFAQLQLKHYDAAATAFDRAEAAGYTSSPICATAGPPSPPPATRRSRRSPSSTGQCRRASPTAGCSPVTRAGKRSPRSPASSSSNCGSSAPARRIPPTTSSTSGWGTGTSSPRARRTAPTSSRRP